MSLKNEEEKEEEQPVAAAIPTSDDNKVSPEKIVDSEEGTNENDGRDEDASVGDQKRYKITLAADAPWTKRMWEVFTTFWPLGLIAFGGPPAHVGLLRDHLVVQRNWLDEDQFSELFAIGQVRRYETTLKSTLFIK